MKTKLRLFMTGGLLVGLTALGCQALPSSQPGAGASAPRSVVHFGTRKLEADADIAVVFNRIDCPDAAGTYGLKQLASPNPDPSVSYIWVEVTGTGLVQPYLQKISRNEFVGCTATLNLTGLAPGDYVVRFTSYDAQDKPVAYATGTAQVDLSRTAQLDLQCDFNVGKLDVNINCCKSPIPTIPPSPAPTTTPTPTPVPTATPTPTPTPIPPVDPTAVMSFVFGFTVDERDNVYLYGVDPGYATVPNSTVANNSRVIRVTAAGQAETTPLFDDILGGHGIAAAPGEVHVFTRNSEYVELDSVSNAVKQNYTVSYPITGGWSLTANAQGAGVFAANRTQLIYVAALPAPFSPYVEWIPPTVAETTSYTPRNMCFDAAADSPVWAAKAGLYMKGATKADAPVLLVDTTGFKEPIGVCPADDPATGFLFTVLDDPGIYRWNKGDATYTQVGSVSGMDAYRLARGADGAIYVLAFATGPAAYGNQSVPSSNNYQVIKFRMVNGQLQQERVVVDNTP